MDALYTSFIIIVGYLIALFLIHKLFSNHKSPEEQKYEDEEQTTFLANWEEERKKNKSK